MKFRSEIDLPPSDWQLSHKHRVICVGSCFAEMLGQRLSNGKFRTLVNPFGIIYNPPSLLKPLSAALGADNGFPSELFEHRGLWRSYDLHSKLSHRDRRFLERIIAGATDVTKMALQSADLLVMTFGTALAWRHLASDALVANCHSVPQKEFQQEMLRMDDMRAAFTGFYKQLRKANPNIRLLLTVSPVRHLRSGLVPNGASKAMLRVLCHRLAEELEGVDYFPAYEIMIDDLRDYRFVRDDLMHPTEFAEQYIWEKFAGAWITADTQTYLRKLEEIRRGLAHRPAQPGSEAHREFLEKLQTKIQELNVYLDCSDELAEVASRLETSS